MAIALSTLGAAFAAFYVWLAVQLINRRERWAKWLAAGLVFSVVYPASFGPVCWIASRSGGHRFIRHFYRPLMQIADVVQNPALNKSITRYSLLGSANGWMWVRIPPTPSHNDNWQWVRVRGGSITL